MAVARRRPVPVVLGGVLLCLVGGPAGLGCFTDPINRPPAVGAINASPPTIMRGDPIQFTATAVDPDQDSVTLTWAYVRGPCADSADRANWPSDRVAPPPGMEAFMVLGSSTMEPFCVWVFATDRFGAVDVKTIQEDPTNRPPVARIGIKQPDLADIFPLYSDFRLSAADSFDPEGKALTYEWNLEHSPSGSTASAGPCPMGGMDVTCLFADLAGVYIVSLKVKDPDSGQSSTSVTLSVAEDHPPCITASTPEYLSANLIHDPMTSETFSVDRVTDDGDPYPMGPHGQVDFSWSIGHGAAPLVFQPDNNFHSLPVAGETFSLGETGRVRVEIHDRKTRLIDDILAGCSDEMPLCESPLRSGCFQRITWSISYR